jgi:hypothetical protein
MKSNRLLRERAHVFRCRLGAPTDADARAKTEKLIRNLERAPTADSKVSRALVKRLACCCAEDPCHSAVCHACALNHQALAMAKLETVWPPGTELISDTIIIKKLERPLGKLNTLQPASIQRAFRRKLQAAGCQLIPIWAYVDISYNSHAQDKYEPHWLAHLHIVAEAKYRRNIKNIAKVLKRSTSIKRPTNVKPIKHWITQVSYVCKPLPQQRRDFHREKRTAKPGKYPLTSAQSIEFALWLSERHPRDRHFWCGKAAH